MIKHRLNVFMSPASREEISDDDERVREDPGFVGEGFWCESEVEMMWVDVELCRRSIWKVGRHWDESRSNCRKWLYGLVRGFVI